MWQQIHLRPLYHYLRWVHDCIYYRKRYFPGRETVPAPGTSVIFVSNHQNAINDPLAIEFGFADRFVGIFAKAGAFKNKWAGWFLRSIYVFPAYRLKTEGEEQLQRNHASFDAAGKFLQRGNSIAIYPEVFNQDKHWLGDFSLGYLQMAFHAAQMSGYTQDIHIVPLGIHYSDYFEFRGEMMVQCGPAISLKPYYEKFQTKPRTVQREINAQVRAAVQGLMLDIRDVAHYESIEFIRNSLGKELAAQPNGCPAPLPEQLRADQDLVARLAAFTQAQPLEAEAFFTDCLRLQAEETAAGLPDYLFWQKKRPLWQEIGVLIVLFPLFLIGCVPNLLACYASCPWERRFRAQGGPFTLFIGGIRYALNALLVLPLSYTLVCAVEAGCFGWLPALLHLLLQVPLGLLAWHYHLRFRRCLHRLRFLHRDTASLRDWRNRLLAVLRQLPTVGD